MIFPLTKYLIVDSLFLGYSLAKQVMAAVDKKTKNY